MQSTKNRLQVVTEARHAEVVTGGKLNISMQDARALYKLTQIDPIRSNQSTEDYENDRREKYELVRQWIRTIAKKILFTAGASTEIEDLIAKI